MTTNRLLRLTSATDFERVRRDGRSHAHPLVVVVARRQTEPGNGATRVGYTAGRKVGSAVARNRAKRLLREAMRHLSPQIPAGWDVVLIARPPLAEARLADAQAAVASVLRRARVLAAASSERASVPEQVQSPE